MGDKRKGYCWVEKREVVFIELGEEGSDEWLCVGCMFRTSGKSLDEIQKVLNGDAVEREVVEDE